MSRRKRMTEVYRSAAKVIFDDSDRFILFSDCHRGDCSWADDFSHNRNLFFYALQKYYEEGYTYIEIGDGDELWENRRFEEIRRNYSDIFKLMREFHLKKRLYMIWGNHDKERKHRKAIEKTLRSYYDEKTGASVPLFDDIALHEGLVLKYLPAGNTVFLVHGHQGDLFNDTLWWLARFLSRTLWRPLQLAGVNDPTRPAQNFHKRRRVERKILRWVSKENQMTITGHTHRPRFPRPGLPPYFNDGSCVHPRSITGIEIVDGHILLIKWGVTTTEEGYLRIEKNILVGPEKLVYYFSMRST